MLTGISRAIALLCAMSVFGAAECSAKCGVEECLQPPQQRTSGGTSHEACHHHQGAPSQPHPEDHGKTCGHSVAATDRIEKAPSKVTLGSSDLLLEPSCPCLESAKFYPDTSFALTGQSPPTASALGVLTINLRI